MFVYVMACRLGGHVFTKSDYRNVKCPICGGTNPKVMEVRNEDQSDLRGEDPAKAGQEHSVSVRVYRRRVVRVEDRLHRIT